MAAKNQYRAVVLTEHEGHGFKRATSIEDATAKIEKQVRDLNRIGIRVVRRYISDNIGNVVHELTK